MSSFEDHDNFLSYEKEFTGIRAFDHGIDTCTWDMGIDFLLNPDSNEKDQSLSFNKIDFFVDHMLNKSLFVCADDKFWCNQKTVEKIKTNYIQLPGQPMDDMVTKVLLKKFTSITHPHIFLLGINLHCSNSKIRFHYTDANRVEFPKMDDWVPGPMRFHDKPWWDRDDTDTFDLVPIDQKELDNPPRNSVTFKALDDIFNQSKEKQGEVIDIKGFQPKIIK